LLAKSTAQCEQAALPWAGLSAEKRVRAFLDDFRMRTDQPLPMTRAQIGQYLGIAEETVVRALSRLRDGAGGALVAAQTRSKARSHTP
jgi:CRP-like cAMP-binding protein